MKSQHNHIILVNKVDFTEKMEDTPIINLYTYCN